MQKPKAAASAKTSGAATDLTGASDLHPAGRTTKSAVVLAMLQRPEGATVAELNDATSWQPHTTRAMLTGLRKKGHTIECGKRDGVTCYHVPIVSA